MSDTDQQHIINRRNKHREYSREYRKQGRDKEFEKQRRLERAKHMTCEFCQKTITIGNQYQHRRTKYCQSHRNKLVPNENDTQQISQSQMLEAIGSSIAQIGELLNLMALNSKS